MALELLYYLPFKIQNEGSSLLQGANNIIQWGKTFISFSKNKERKCCSLIRLPENINTTSITKTGSLSLLGFGWIEATRWAWLVMIYVVQSDKLKPLFSIPCFSRNKILWVELSSDSWKIEAIILSWVLYMSFRELYRVKRKKHEKKIQSFHLFSQCHTGS